jgi:predicted nucleic acid-binding protein
MMVLDASAALEMLLNASSAATLRDRVTSRHERVHVPHLIDLEILQVFRRFISRGAFDVPAAQAAMFEWGQLKLYRVAHIEFLDRILELRDNFTAYDAAYIALAEALDAPLVTHDAKFARTKGHNARVELI